MLHDSTFIEILEIVKRQSSCVYYKTGALVVKENRIVSMGYNGSPSGFPQCDELQEVLEFAVDNKDIVGKYLEMGGVEAFARDYHSRFKYFYKYTQDFVKFFGIKLEESLKKICNGSAGQNDFYNLNFIHSRYEIHAEQNAIAFSLKAGTNITGATLYTTLLPCMECAKLIVASGIKRVVYIEDYEDKRFKESSKTFLEINGIKVDRFTKD
uniref:CMP/dCMP-type deaminase domain-containing protein n=1 Tax=candidate division WOR-3 bacterium TaxID=2052148 RepID=A0A7C2NZU1_UNCW3